MIKKISIANGVATITLTAAVAAFGTAQQAMNCAFAGVLVGLNLIVIVWSLRKIFQKKSVALAVSVIVFKYAALIVCFVLLSKMGWALDIGFVIGLSAMFPTIGFLAYKQIKLNETHDTL